MAIKEEINDGGVRSQIELQDRSGHRSGAFRLRPLSPRKSRKLIDFRAKRGRARRRGGGREGGGGGVVGGGGAAGEGGGGGGDWATT